ncbi:MAG: TonB-dependent receptor [Bacteroidota bacterium]
MKNICLVIMALFVGNYAFGQTQPKVESLDSVFIDSKTPTARKNSGKVVVVIDAKTLEAQPGKNVAEVLTEVSGIEINGSRSNAGANLGYFVRGGRNRQVLIVIDGVQLSDPSSIANDFDLRLLNASSVEKIEIIKGASSVLYGSGAATAVISITTKKASKKEIAAVFTSSLGSDRAEGDENSDLESFTNAASVNGTLGKFDYRLDFGHRYSNGLSAVSAPEGAPNFEEDVYNQFNTQVNLGYAISEKIKINRFFAVDNYTAEFDDFSYVDADNRINNEQLRTGGRLQWDYGKGSVVLSDNHSWIDRSIESGFPAMFDATSSSFDVFGSYRLNDQFTLIAGVNGVFSKFNSFTIPFGESQFMQDVNEDTANFSIVDPYVNATYRSDFGLNVNAGVRLNNHSDYGTHFVYSVNPSYGIDLGNSLIKLLGSYSTAYITPSLFQLYDPLYGNDQLEPEENTTIEGGLEFSMGKDLRVSAVYFNRDEDNFVDFVTVDPELFIFQYQNIAESFTASGVEVEVFKRFGKDVSFSANYTNTQVDESLTLRIPEHKANARLGYTLNPGTQFDLSYHYVGARDDVFFNPDTFESEMIELESYGLLHFNASHQVTKVIRVFLNLSNILDEAYEEVFRFQTRGRNFRVGFELKF